ncbi:hypothetical protein [Hoylesella marshii]|uniref:Uncharacterized protein n=1 Tax=Hoylesella marshii DSM 16973 = JCM 13450 TaxID=862515 RepID=E0NTL6_9BACT|nr:hypothetical protein [Hoylesella marshii]EFM01399.1 hypothetical protein HMPREF0658_1518 [Hoylesella marshii DSM 16973 = JCM 13450]
MTNNDKIPATHMLLRFYAKCLLLALPFIALCAAYVAEDPFMVLRNYDDYDHPTLCQNEGMVSWLKYKRYRSKMHYDSFIMGSSCTMAYECSEWKKYIKGSPFRMFCNAEGMADILQKVEALDREPHQRIRNLLIVLEDRMVMKSRMQTDAMHIMPPEVSGMGWVKYQTTFLQAFCSPSYLFPYVKYKLGWADKKEIKGIVNTDGATHTRYTNDAVLTEEHKIDSLGNDYWKQGAWEKQGKEPQQYNVLPAYLSEPQQVTLRKIAAICRRHGTDVRIIIGPSYHQTAFNPADVAVLRRIFGKASVYDFSDSAHHALTAQHNYYDPPHYRKQVGRQILREVYGASPNRR